MQSAIPGGPGVASGSAATAPASPTGARHLQSTGNTPSAKRPATLTSMTGSAGPAMTAVDANAFMYALRYKIESFEKWALTVSESITDHAEHIDVTRARAAHSFHLVSDEINKLRSSAATGESDTRQVMKLVQENDDTLKASIAGVVELLGSTIAKTQADLESRSARHRQQSKRCTTTSRRRLLLLNQQQVGTKRRRDSLSATSWKP